MTEKKKIGRPKKAKVQSVTKGQRRGVGRPKGDAAIINEYKARMLASPKSKKVLDSIMNAALDDEHKNQAAAWKICMDSYYLSAILKRIRLVAAKAPLTSPLLALVARPPS